jgi:hypothetical protein
MSWWVGVSREDWPKVLAEVADRLRTAKRLLQALATTSMARHQRTRAQRARDRWNEEV